MEKIGRENAGRSDIIASAFPTFRVVYSFSSFIHSTAHSIQLIHYIYTEEKLYSPASSTIALPSAVEFLRLQRFNVCAWLPVGVKRPGRFVSGSTSSALNSP